MGKVIFTHSERSAYDDDPSRRYHFPRTYLRQAEQALGDWIVYYEPRRNDGPSSSQGRQAYFAMARLIRIEPDMATSDHYYAYLTEYVEFDQPIPFRDGIRVYEAALQKPDGTTNKGAFGRSVRVLPESEFEAIVATGFARSISDDKRIAVEQLPRIDAVQEPVPEYVARPKILQILNRKFREHAFRRHVREAYNFRCAMTGWRILDVEGKPEAQAAHIRPVEKDGPDSVRNGLVLSATLHWLFDRGLIAIDDSFKALKSPQGIPDDLGNLIRTDRPIFLPTDPDKQPHRTYLGWHRANRFRVV
jgi:putative restriction endonuclease